MILAVLDWLRHARRRKTWAATQVTGRRGEDLAHRFLRRKGFVIVARNYRLDTGDAEADILARDGESLVVVEVKTRETGAFGPPDRAVGEEKFRHMLRVAREYSSKTSTPWEHVRFDVVTVLLNPAPAVTHFRGAWTPK